MNLSPVEHNETLHIENISILSHSQPIFTFYLNKITHYPLIICDSDIYNYWKVNYNENQFKFA